MLVFAALSCNLRLLALCALGCSGEANDFVLSVFTEAPFKFQPLRMADEWHHVALAGEWTAQSGGCPNPENRSWHLNPQWRLAVSEPTALTLSLEVALPTSTVPESEGPLPAIGCLLLHGSSARKAVIDAVDVVAHTGFVPLAQASVHLELPPSDEPYTLLACTFEPGQQVCAAAIFCCGHCPHLLRTTVGSGL